MLQYPLASAWPTPSPYQVSTVTQLEVTTESLTTTVPTVHGVIDAAKIKDMTSIAEAATV